MNLMGAILFLFFSFSLNAHDILLSAMKDELLRFEQEIKGKTEYPIYFIGYEAWKKSGLSMSVKMDSQLSQSSYSYVVAVCDVRVGSTTLDSTHEIKSDDHDDNSRYLLQAQLAYDADAIKTQLWLLTDETLKRAIERYTRVIANKNITAEEEDKSGDFIYDVELSTFYKTQEDEFFDNEKIKEMMKRLGAEMKKYRFLIDGDIYFTYTNQSRYIVNSQGTSIVEGGVKYLFSWSLYSRTSDGTDISSYRSYYFKSISEMPDFNDIKRDFDEGVSVLERQLYADNLAPYSGPAILKNKAAAVFWHEIFGHRIEGHRQKGEKEGLTFADKLGKQIMPDFISIYDDPTLEYYAGKFLNGHYLYDDEGVRAERTILVKDGLLKNFLMQRVPVRGVMRSNGHGRRSSGYMTVSRQGNLIAEFKNPLSYDELEKRLIELIRKSGKPYGLIINDIEGGYTYTKRTMPQSYTILIKDAVLVYPDGKKIPVKGLNMIGTPLQTFSKIVAAADDYDVFNGVCGAESGWVDVSAVSGSLLFSEIETQRTPKSNKKPPLLPPPHFDSNLSSEEK